MEQFLLSTLLVIAVGLPILGMGSVLWSDYQNYKQSKKEEALRLRKETLKEEFINLYGGEEKFYHDMRIAIDAAHEASLALSMCNWLERNEPHSENIDVYRTQHREKADYYYKHNPEFKLRDYIQERLTNQN